MRTLLLIAALVLPLFGGEARGIPCRDRLARLLPVARAAQQRGFDGVAYQAALSRWAGRLAGVPVGEPQGDVIRAALEAETIRTPEEIFALVDALDGKPGGTFYETLQAIQTSGVGILLQSYRLPYGLRPSGSVQTGAGSPRSPTYRTQRVGRRFTLLPAFLAPQGQLFTLMYPDVVPRGTDELVQLVYHYASTLAYFRVDLLARRSPLASLPAGPVLVSHPQRVMNEIELAQNFIYSRLRGISEAIPEVELPLPERDGVWRWRHAQLLKDGLFCVLFPIYRPMSVFGPSREGYEAFLAAEAAGEAQAPSPQVSLNERKYRNRLRLGWLSDRWRNLLVTAALLSLWNAGSRVVDAIASGDISRFMNAPATLSERFSPERMNRVMEDYSKDPKGFEPVNDHFGKQIREVEEAIRRGGDPDGKLRKHIEELERRRDFLKN